jgi:hypothetical protein
MHYVCSLFLRNSLVFIAYPQNNSTFDKIKTDQLLNAFKPTNRLKSMNTMLGKLGGNMKQL